MKGIGRAGRLDATALADARTRAAEEDPNLLRFRGGYPLTRGYQAQNCAAVPCVRANGWRAAGCGGECVLLDDPQTLRHNDAGVWFYVKLGDHCFLAVPDEILTFFGQDRSGPRLSSLIV